MCRGIFIPGAMGFTLFQCQINITVLSTRLHVMIPATAAAGLCTPGLLQPFVPSWRRLQSSKQKGTIFSPGNRSPSSHKAKQNYAMSQDNVLGMWSLAVCSQHSHSSRQLRAGEQHKMVERLHPSTSQTPQMCCRKKGLILPTLSCQHLCGLGQGELLASPAKIIPKII